MNNSNDDDKTRFKPETKADGVAEDRTRIAKPLTTGVKPNPAAHSDLPASDKTRIQGKPILPAQPVSDKTQFVPNKKINPATIKTDPTRVAPVTSPEERPILDTDPTIPRGHATLKNRFVFEELLGAGGMGMVYKAKDLLKIEAQDREPYVAIKVLSDEFKTHPEAFMALQRESRKSQKIAHPNIVNVHDFDRDGDTVFMTMEYMEGKPLDKLIAQYRSIGLPTEDALKILDGICAALAYAHAQHIIHSDFKPGNIFVNNNGVAKVFDFGIARAVAKAENREESADDKTVFDAGKLGALTPAYASLEMLEGKTPDIRDDIYALGCIAYELYTGKHPYNRVHADEAKRQKLKPQKIAGLSKHQWRAIERAIAFDREDRSESVEAFWKEFNKKTSHTVLIVFLLILVVGVSGGLYYKYKPNKPVALTEEQLRGQVEKKLRLELQKEELKKAMDEAEFSAGVESKIWDLIQDLRLLLGKEDPWLVQQEAAIYARYIKEIEKSLASGDYAQAQSLVKNAYRYSLTPEQLKEFEATIAKKIEDKNRLEQERREQQQAQQKVVVQERQQADKEAETIAQKNTAFSVALSNVDKQLECKSSLDMKDFEIAITKLRSINMPQYTKEEPRITETLAHCIVFIGSSFPERAEAAKTYALRIFTGNATIAAISIVQKDPCSTSLAGLGARGLGASCKDKMNGVTKIPTLVVVPAKAGMKAFAIGKYEVSMDEFMDYCQQSKACSVSSGDDVTLPVTNISLANAIAYSKWLSDKANRKYRLPTLAEWQYAAKASSARVDQNRNCKLNSRGIQKGDSLIKVSLGQQNDWGLVNTLGNAREWAIERDGSALAVGGSYDTPIEECDLNSQAAHSGQPDKYTGFRLVREVNDQ